MSTGNTESSTYLYTTPSSALFFTPNDCLKAVATAERILRGKRPDQVNERWFAGLLQMLGARLGRPGELVADRLSEGRALNFKDRQLLEELIRELELDCDTAYVSSNWIYTGESGINFT